MALFAGLTGLKDGSCCFRKQRQHTTVLRAREGGVSVTFVFLCLFLREGMNQTVIYTKMK